MFKKKLNELAVPPIVTTDPRAYEIARIWAAHGGQHVSLKVMLVSDPSEWGLVLVDLARHVANFYNQEQGFPVDKVLSRIKEGFDAEWSTYTTDITGNVMGDRQTND